MSFSSDFAASGYSGGGAFIFLHAPAVVAGAFLFPAVCRVAFSVPLYGVFLSGYILSVPISFLPVCVPCGVRAVIHAHFRRVYGAFSGSISHVFGAQVCP